MRGVYSLPVCQNIFYMTSSDYDIYISRNVRDTLDLMDNRMANLMD